MRINEIITEDIGRRDFLKWMGAGALAAGGVAAGLTPGDAQAGTQMGPKEFGFDRWDKETKNLEAKLPGIFKRLMSVAGKDAPLFKDVHFMVGSVPSVAKSYSDGLVAFDLSVFYDLSDDAIAYNMAHEMGHIAAGTTKGYKGMSQTQAHNIEKDADVYGCKLAHMAGYNPNQAFADYDAAAKREKAGPTHPDYKTRIQNVKQKTGIDVALLKDLEHKKQAILNYASAMA